MPGPGESPLGSSTLLPPSTSPALGCCEITWYLSKNHTFFYPLATLEGFLYFGEVSLTLSLDPLIGVEFSSESCPWPFGGAWLGPCTAQSPLCPGAGPTRPAAGSFIPEGGRGGELGAAYSLPGPSWEGPCQGRELTGVQKRCLKSSEPRHIASRVKRAL